MKPLIEELKVSVEIQRRATECYDDFVQELKEMSCMVRIPIMQTEFWKMMRKREGERIYETHQK